MKQVGIVVALPGELRTLTKRKIPIGCWARISDQLLIAMSGAGSAHASAAAKLLLQHGANALLSWGCAAALQSRLRAGHLVLPEQIRSADGMLYQVDSVWHRQIYQAVTNKIERLDSGPMVESRLLVATAHEKQILANTSNAVAVDMESAALARLAEERDVPFMAVRAIADPIEMSLPEAVSRAMDHNGDVNISRLLSHLILHPGGIGALIRLGLQFRAAQTILCQVSDILEHNFCGVHNANKNWESGST